MGENITSFDMAIEVFTAEKLLEWSFGAIVGKLTEGAIAALWGAIRQRLQQEPIAEAEIVEVEQNYSQESLKKLIPFLQVEMLKDPQFNQNLQQLAQEVAKSSQDTFILNVSNPQNSPVAGEHKGDIIYGDKINVKK